MKKKESGGVGWGVVLESFRKSLESPCPCQGQITREDAVELAVRGGRGFHVGKQRAIDLVAGEVCAANKA